MAKKVNQIRFYGDGNKKNYPDNLTSSKLATGNAFSDTQKIVQLGIQSLPGMKFYINGHKYPIVVGQTGIYELNVDGLSYIQKLQFDITILGNINKNKGSSYLIVDYIYEEGD